VGHVNRCRTQAIVRSLAVCSRFITFLYVLPGTYFGIRFRIEYNGRASRQCRHGSHFCVILVYRRCLVGRLAEMVVVARAVADTA